MDDELNIESFEIIGPFELYKADTSKSSFSIVPVPIPENPKIECKIEETSFIFNWVTTVYFPKNVIYSNWGEFN